MQQPAAGDRPFNVELALVFDDVPAAFEHAVASGCTPLAEPALKPHGPGQTVGWVRDPFGTLIEIASPIAGSARRRVLALVRTALRGNLCS
ncbi:hypothetical protein BH20ACT17_BH20ACT17_17900 [soil metagenome]